MFFNDIIFIITVNLYLGNLRLADFVKGTLIIETSTYRFRRCSTDRFMQNTSRRK